MENDGHGFVEFDYGMDVAHRYGVERGGGLDGVYDQMVAVDFDGGFNGDFLEQQGYVELVGRRRPLPEFFVNGIYDFLLNHTFDRFKAQDKKREVTPRF